MNDFIEKDEIIDIPILQISKDVEELQVKRIKELKTSRDNVKVSETLHNLDKAARDGSNLMPYILDCARNYVTLEEMIFTLKEVFGVYVEQAVF